MPNQTESFREFMANTDEQLLIGFDGPVSTPSVSEYVKERLRLEAIARKEDVEEMRKWGLKYISKPLWREFCMKLFGEEIPVEWEDLPTNEF